MAYSKIERTVYDLAAPAAAECGCYIYDVEYVKEGGGRVLRIYADKESGGISIDECETISRAVSAALDTSDPIKENYMLEVSSPGIERKLRQPEHFEKYIGETVDVGLFKAVNGSKQLCGELAGYEDKTVILKTDDEEIKIPQNETTFVKLHFDF